MELFRQVGYHTGNAMDKICTRSNKTFQGLYIKFWEWTEKQWKKVKPEAGTAWFLPWRSILHFLQRRSMGFDNSDTWSLRNTHAEWILPRLKRFKRLTISHPSDITAEEWEEVIQSMIDAFELVLELDKKVILNTRETILLEKGLGNFEKYYLNLWW